jgi:uronate dehydrogenase
LAAKPRVLICGIRGLVGEVLKEALESDYDIVGLDARARRFSRTRADTTRLWQAERALDGVDVVIDLASTHWQQPWEAVYRNNLPACWNVLEAARRRGVRRVVYASSNHVIGGYELDQPYARIVQGDYSGLDPAAVPRLDATVAIRPDTPYGVGKALGEAAARYYSDVHGLSVVCLRIGSLNRASRPSVPRHFATLLTHADMAHLARCCIEAPPTLRFGIYYGVSANTWRIWDIDGGRREIGYKPRDDAERWRGAAVAPSRRRLRNAANRSPGKRKPAS